MTLPVTKGLTDETSLVQRRSHCLFVASDPSSTRASAELALHVLAQCADSAFVSLPATLEGDPSIGILATAYAVDSRVHFRSARNSNDSADGAITVDAATETPATLCSRLGWGAVGEPVFLDRVLEGQRLVVVTNIPIHYRIALFHALDQQLARQGGSLHVLFLAHRPRDRGWIADEPLDFSYEFVGSVDASRGRGRRLIPRVLTRRLDELAPTVVLSAGFSPLVSGRLARWCKRSGRASFGVWSGEILSTPTAKSRLRRMQRRRLLGNADFGVAYGWESARFLRMLDGALPTVIGRNTTLLPQSRPARDRTPVEVLVVSRAEVGKAIDLVLEAVLEVQDIPVRLTIVGDGPELPALRRRAGASNRVRFLGALPHAEVMSRYPEADVFAFPSRYDVFGLVLVEAMGSGLAVLTSDAPGAVSDLAVDGLNCLIVREQTVEGWARALRRVAQDSGLRRKLGEAARETVRSRWTIEHAAAAMVAACRLSVITSNRSVRSR